jgi:transcription elongation factor GreA
MNLKSEKPVYLTSDGKVQLEKELEFLRSVKRRQVAERIQQAKALGDVSESGEYEDAKREQAFVEGRIREIENILKRAVVIDDNGRTDGVVRLGSTVRVVDSEGNEETFTIVGSAESSSLNGRVSNESPVGKALMGRRVGETAKIVAPNGTFELKILAVE